MAKLVWSERAATDIEDIYDYIAKDSPTYAQYQTEHIVTAVERLEQFPESGRHLPEFPHLPHREVIVGRYRVIYRYEPQREAVYLVTVVHGSRLLQSPDMSEDM
jgi:addiction module RelE/StbE family toxin